MKRVRNRLNRLVNTFSIGKKLIILYLFCVLVPLFATDGVILYNVYRSEKTQRKYEMQNVASSVSAELNYIFQEAVDISRSFYINRKINEFLEYPFDTPLDFYEKCREFYNNPFYNLSFESNGLKVVLFGDNEGIINGGQLCRTENIRSAQIYEMLEQSDRDMILCFYYQDNLDILEQSGAELVPFSPIHDKELPPDIGGLLLGGGYPENFAEELSRNHSMLDSVRSAIKAGIPCLAECGGFLYLHDSISDINGQEWNMAGVIGQKASYQGKLQARFGYITVTDKKTGIKVRGHEFHYYDSTDHGSSWEAVKPLSSRHWDCMHSIGNLLAGFPHLYYASNIEFVAGWVGRCRQWKENGIQ